MRLFVRIAAAAPALAAATPASAQYGVIPDVIGMTIGNMAASGAERECLLGKVPDAGEVDEIRGPVSTTMRRYLVFASQAPGADASGAFTRKTKLRTWLHNGTAGTPTAIDDPVARAFATAGNALPAPDILLRSGDGVSALAVWQLPTGRYRALFRRESLPKQAGIAWKLQELELTHGNAAEAPSATQFCHAPGDVERFKVQVAEYEAEQARRRLEKEERRKAREAARTKR